MLVFKTLALWLVLLLVAVGAGALREAALRPRLGELAAHQVGTLGVCALFWLLIALWVQLVGPTPGQALAAGLAMLVATLAFELLFGHYVAGQPWSRLLADYNLFAGRLWLLVPVTVALAPYLLSLTRLARRGAVS